MAGRLCEGYLLVPGRPSGAAQEEPGPRHIIAPTAQSLDDPLHGPDTYPVHAGHTALSLNQLQNIPASAVFQALEMTNKQTAPQQFDRNVLELLRHSERVRSLIPTESVKELLADLAVYDRTVTNYVSSGPFSSVSSSSCWATPARCAAGAQQPARMCWMCFSASWRATQA